MYAYLQPLRLPGHAGLGIFAAEARSRRELGAVCGVRVPSFTTFSMGTRFAVLVADEPCRGVTVATTVTV